MIVDLLRPDDLLALRVETRNLRLDTGAHDDPRLVRERPHAPAFLIFHFPPQSIVEKAYFEVSTQTNPPFNLIPPPPPLPAASDPFDAPGAVPVRMSGPSRLVFRLPDDIHAIPFALESLLDWSRLQPELSRTALGRHQPLPIQAPGPLATALEMPYRLVVSPARANARWQHASGAVVHAGRAELWHTRLSTATANSTELVEADERHPVAIRAIWSPDFADHGPMPSHATDDVPFRGAMSPRDRHQIVALTSGVDGYFVVGASGGSSVYVPQP